MIKIIFNLYSILIVEKYDQQCSISKRLHQYHFWWRKKTLQYLFLSIENAVNAMIIGMWRFLACLLCSICSCFKFEFQPCYERDSELFNVTWVVFHFPFLTMIYIKFDGVPESQHKCLFNNTIFVSILPSTTSTR